MANKQNAKAGFAAAPGSAADGATETTCSRLATDRPLSLSPRKPVVRWWSGVAMTDDDVWGAALAEGWTPLPESRVLDAVEFLSKNGHKIAEIKTPNIGLSIEKDA